MNDASPGRRKLVLLALMFAAPILLATVLAFSGWLPSGRRNYGELVDPPQRIQVAGVTLAGQPFAWTTPQWHWTMIVRIPEVCDAPCRTRLDQVVNLRISLGRHAEKLRIATDRGLPADVVLAKVGGVYTLADLPPVVQQHVPAARIDIALALVDPAGYLMLRYPEQADLARVRRDVGKLIR